MEYSVLPTVATEDVAAGVVPDEAVDNGVVRQETSNKNVTSVAVIALPSPNLLSCLIALLSTHPFITPATLPAGESL
jgi:hypothetical protein